MKFPNRLLLEQGGPGHRGPELPRCDVPVRPLGERLREAMDIPIWDPPDLDKTVGMLRAAIGENSAENEAEIGRAAPLAEILALAASIR